METEKEIFTLCLKMTVQNLGCSWGAAANTVAPGRGTALVAATGYPMVLSDYWEDNGPVGHKIHHHRGAKARRDTF